MKASRKRHHQFQKMCNHLSSALMRAYALGLPSEMVEELKNYRDKIEAYAIREDKKAARDKRQKKGKL